ncbi:rod shape-determining protein MreC [Candidatus Uhrbacteria bacterium]|nr:rod shape-determining protein MreC [Candidatus Uhrbacteria bacterium]
MRKILSIASIIAGLGIIFATSALLPVERVVLGISANIFGINARDLPYVAEVCDASLSARSLLLSQENQDLREQLRFVKRSKVEMLGAPISGYATDPARSLYVVARGTQDGVRAGAPVIAGDGNLIGTVQSADAQTSMVRPVHDPRSKILVVIPGEKASVHGIAEGRFGVGVELTTVPITEELRTGDSVMTSGLQQGIPAGLVVGTISDIKKNPEDLFQTASLSIPHPAVPPRNISIIIQPTNEPD